MSSHFVKFPSTPHLAVLEGAAIRGDKVLSARKQQLFLSHEILVEEKVDGANLGISFDDLANIHAQNRGSYLKLPAAGQWKLLDGWLNSRVDTLFQTLTDRYILFGEWCYARHSIFYDRLPDWFLGFDIFDCVSQRFVNSITRHRMFTQAGIQSVPQIARGQFAFSQIVDLLRESRLGSEPAEGLYLRYDQGEWLAHRAKLVQERFMQSIEQHWTRRPLRTNQLRTDCAK